jgi:hypothetical protein
MTRCLIGLSGKRFGLGANDSIAFAEQARRLLVALGAVRVLIGVVAFVAPGLPTAAWIGGDTAKTPAARLFARALGGRDLALGLGAVASADDPFTLARWAAMGALADAGDVGATLIAYRHLPRRARALVLLSAGGAAIAGKLGATVLWDAPRRSS